MMLSLLFVTLVQPGPQVDLSVKTSPTALVPGQLARGIVTIVLPEGFHGYQNPPSNEYLIPIQIFGANVLSARYPAGALAKSPGEEKPVAIYSGKIAIPFTFQASGAELKISVRFQLCDDSACLPPTTKQLALKLANGSPVPGAVRLGRSLATRAWRSR